MPSDNQITEDIVDELRWNAVPDRLRNRAAAEIERLRAELSKLHGLDVTAREGQAAFNEWRNRSVNNGRR